jgi:hypothetical protein
MMRKVRVLAVAAVVAAAFGGIAAAATPDDVKPRVIVVSDIGNEPDDSESFVRLLLYGNQLDLRGLIASTSTWQREIIHAELMLERIDAYGKVLANLRRHDGTYPDAAALRALVKRGQPHYGMSHVGDGFDTEASNWIIAEADKPDPRPLWILNWGGSADLAQALYTVRKTRSPEQVQAFAARLRVYSISDQDDAGPWARQNFPELFWIASIHAFSQYDSAEWPGISGDVGSDPHAEHVAGPDTSLVTNEWLDAHIRKGPLGALYPNWKYIMEGDTPSFLHLIGRGLNDPEHPEWGGWGGRYGKVAPQYGLYSNAADTATGADGKRYHSSQASIWRWRRAFQNDFAARIQWTLTPSFKKANHAPAVRLNGQGGYAPVEIPARVGNRIALSAAGTRDPDGNRLTYWWWWYPEAGVGLYGVKLEIAGADTSEASFTVPATASSMPGDPPQMRIHVVLEVWDDGVPALAAYRRAIVTVTR